MSHKRGATGAPLAVLTRQHVAPGPSHGDWLQRKNVLCVYFGVGGLAALVMITLKCVRCACLGPVSPPTSAAIGESITADVREAFLLNADNVDDARRLTASGGFEAALRVNRLQ